MNGNRDEWHDRDEGPRQGAAHGNLFGSAEHDAAQAFYEHRDGDDPRARAAADDWNQRFGREGHEGSYAQHDPYERYRERHLAEMDRDYDEWCRTREQAFHSEFDDWRQRRRQAPASNQPGGDEMILSDRVADRLEKPTETAPPTRARRARR